MRETLSCQETDHSGVCAVRAGWGFNFLYFTTAVDLISCVNHYELNGWRDRATEEETLTKPKVSCCRGKRRQGQKSGDIYSQLISL